MKKQYNRNTYYINLVHSRTFSSNPFLLIDKEEKGKERALDSTFAATETQSRHSSPDSEDEKNMQQAVRESRRLQNTIGESSVIPESGSGAIGENSGTSERVNSNNDNPGSIQPSIQRPPHNTLIHDAIVSQSMQEQLQRQNDEGYSDSAGTPSET